MNAPNESDLAKQDVGPPSKHLEFDVGDGSFRPRHGVAAFWQKES